MKGILGRKVGMTQIFDDEGKVVPVTVIAVEPSVISQVKTVDNDGYSAAQIAFEECNVNRLNRPEQGHLASAGVQPRRYLKEYGIQDGASVAVGDTVSADTLFTVGEKVVVVGVSKGKGFAGVVKRFHFHGADMTHGSMIHRKPQSGGATDAARTFKGTRKPGRMGNEQVSQQGLRVVRIDAEKNIILVKGAVPGANGGLLSIEKARRAEKVRVRQETQRSSKKK
ncbi:large subunit ribosomal protein L3 [Armatimonas rosea]|uniref:Large ribosomal subunit protein uL3 n=1 Tax=Armatimonas rosea TaxID=685828 RepID=A0A7W9SRR0_ARMRO|nr:large subunit ribosomal protein L3 [Armatimonas rosea]